MRKQLFCMLTAVSSLLVATATPAFADGYGGKDGAVASQENLVPNAPVEVRFTGFQPNTEVDIYFQSTPIFLGRFLADQTGTVTVTVNVPKEAADGDHHIVAFGIDASGAKISPSIAVRVSGASLALTGANTGHKLVLAGLLIVVGMAGMAAARRRLEPTIDIDSLGGSPTRFRA